MDDLTNMLQQVLDDPESMKQIQAVAASLGLGEDASPPSSPANEAASSGLASLLAGLSGDAPSSTPSNPPDLSALSGLVQNIAGKNENTQHGDVRALAALLNNGQSHPAPASGGLPFDMGTLLKLQKAMSTIGSNRENIELLMALKPRLKAGRAKKIDDAVRVMQLIQFLPLLKESGLFGDLKDGIGGLLGMPGGRRS